MWDILDTNGQRVATMDPSGTPEQLRECLRHTFRMRYEGNRAPMGIFLHAMGWLGSDPVGRAAVLNEFIAWARTHPDVWFVSLGAAADFMRDPRPAAAAGDFPPFVTAVTARIPTNEVQTRQYTEGYLRCCSEPPPRFPLPDTVYLHYAAFPGGTATVQALEQWTDGFKARLTLTGAPDEAAEEWRASFTLEGAHITWFSDVHYVQDGARVTLGPSGSARGLGAGAVLTREFGGTRTSGVVVADAQIELRRVEPIRPDVRWCQTLSDGQVRLEWTDAGYGYVVQTAAGNLPDAPWDDLPPIYGVTSRILPTPTNTPVFFRVRTAP